MIPLRLSACMPAAMLLVLFAHQACDRGTETAGAQPAARPAPALGPVEFKLDSGAEAFTFKPKEDGSKLEGPDGGELARYTGGPGKLKIKDGADAVLGFAVAKPDRIELQDPEGAPRFRLQRQDDGDWKLEASDGALLVRIKRRDYGWELEDPGKRSLAKAKLKEGKSSLRDAGDRTIYATKDPAPLLGVALLGLERLSLPERGALFVLLERDAAGNPEDRR